MRALRAETMHQPRDVWTLPRNRPLPAAPMSRPTRLITPACRWPPRRPSWPQSHAGKGLPARSWWSCSPDNASAAPPAREPPPSACHTRNSRTYKHPDVELVKPRDFLARVALARVAAARATEARATAWTTAAEPALRAVPETPVAVGEAPAHRSMAPPATGPRPHRWSPGPRRLPAQSRRERQRWHRTWDTGSVLPPVSTSS